MAQETLNTPRETTHQRIADALEDMAQNMSDAHEAVNIDYDNTTSGLSADNVQGAIDELNSEKANTADLGTASGKDFTTSVTQGSNDLVTSGAVWSAIDNLPEPMIFKGTLGVNGTITSLPSASSSNEGWTYKVITAGTYAGQVAKVGDVFTSNGSEWVYIPSGDETDTDTWRGINVNGSQLLGNGISSGNVNFKSGTNAQVSGSGNDVTVDVDTTFADASSRTNIASGDSIKTILGKIKKWFTDLKTVAFTGAYSDLSGQPTIGNGTLTIQKNGTNVQTFSANQTTNATANIQCVDTVDSTMSTTSENPLQNKVITAELAGTKTTQGNPITITDAAPVNAVDVSVDIEPIQDLHGYDNPWVGGAGKNKLPMTVAGIKAANSSTTWNENSTTINGVTYTILTDSDNNVIGIKANGTAGNGGAELSITRSAVLVSGQLINGVTEYISTITGIGVGGSGIVTYNENSYTVSGVAVGSNKNVYIKIGAGDTVSNVLYFPMLRLSTETDSSFAPYTNICPISGRSEVEIDRVGKNWYIGSPSFDGYYGMSGWTKDSSTYNGHDVYKRNTAWEGCFKLIYLPVGTYTFSAMVKGDSNSRFAVYVSGKTGTGTASPLDVNYIANTSWQKYSFTFNVTIAGTFAIRIEKMVTDSNYIYISEFQLELGNTATTYEPYAGKTYTIQLGDTIYGGELDVLTGEMVVTKRSKIFTSTDETQWYQLDSRSIFYAVWTPRDGKQPINTGVTGSISSQYIAVNKRLSNLSNGEFVINSTDIASGDNSIGVCNSRFSNTSDFKASLTTPLEVVYELATPYTIQLTPQQIKLLENTNTLYTDYEGDTIHIEYQPNNAIGEAVRVAEENLDAELITRPQLKRYSARILCYGFTRKHIDITTDKKIIPLFARFDAEYTELYIDYEPRFYNPIVFYDDGTAYINYQASGIPNDNQQRTFEMYYYEV